MSFFNKEVPDIDEELEKEKRPSIFKFIRKHPELSLLVFGTTGLIIIGFVTYMFFSMNLQFDIVLDKYMELSDKRDDSKKDFTKKLFYIVKDSEGNTTITVRLPTGYDNEDEDEDEYIDPTDPGSGGGTDGGGGGNPDPDADWEKPDFDTSQWYSVTNVPASTQTTTVGSWTLYNGSPWGADNFTFINWPAMYSQFVSDVSSALGGSDSWHKDGLIYDEDNYNSASLQTVNGVPCMEMSYYPAWRHQDYYNRDWNMEKPAWYGSDVQNVYGCLVWKDGSGNYWYNPIKSGDNKGHTWPGGVAQTAMQVASVGSTKHQIRYGWAIQPSNIPELPSVGNKVYEGTIRWALEPFNKSSTYNATVGGYNSSRQQLRMSVEINRAFKDSFQNTNSAYTFVGVILHY